MKTGDMNRLITFRQKSIAYNTLNETIDTWADAFTVYAAVYTTGGREFYAAQKLNAETSAVFVVRWTERINTRMRVKWGNRTFEILSLKDVNRTWLEIAAKEVV